MGDIKDKNIKNRAYYFFDDMINIKHFDSDLLKINKNSYENINVYHVEYVAAMKSISDIIESIRKYS